jgi:hypothetical protein
MEETKVSELNQGDVFLFGEVIFELVSPPSLVQNKMALCRITNQCANLYISPDALVQPLL